ncbi:unnamed protein product [Caenorhabditis angaria]|uniref:NR LBD domain-containing protein n=1 Tax=Caenorhabditis angaria TaxID=860376 RepID=A0A9P1IYX3_9PELO|nr:unnamed protein product [Caenorhabditis angaria]
MYSKHESIEHITILENAVDIDSMKAIEAALSHLHISTYNPVFPPSLDEMLSQPIFLNTYKNYKIVCSWPRPEFELIQEQKLLRTFRSSFNDEPKNKHFPDTIHTKDWLTIDAILGVQYLMTLPFFNNLSHMDRIIFGRNSTVRVMCFTVFYKNYEKGNCFIEQPDGLKLNIPEHNQLFMNTKLDKLYVKKFDTNSNNQSLVPFFENLISEEEYLLMKAIIACDPAATNNLSENGRKLIAAQRNKYINILYTLCLNKEGKINGSLRMGNLIRFSRLMEIQQKQLKEFILLSRMYQDETAFGVIRTP